MTADSLAPLCDYVRERMPLRARAIGRAKLRSIVAETVAHWPTPTLMGCRPGSREEHLALSAAETAVCHALERRYGFIWTLLLSAVVSAVIQQVLRWWIERRENQEQIEVWRREAAA